MKKRLIAIILAVVLVCSFAACSKKGGHSDKELYLGGIGPITGDYANYGLSVMYGAQIAVDEINDNGGINGMTIVFNFQESEGDPEKAKNAYGVLMDWGMDVSIGTTFTGAMASVVKESANDNMFMISPSASGDNCLKESSNAFRICFYDAYQGIAAANYVDEMLPGKKVAVFYQSDLDYSIGLYESFRDTASQLGVEIIETQSFTAEETDYSAQINAIADSKAEVVFIPIYAAEASSFLSQAKNGTKDSVFGENVYFFGCDGLDGILTKVEKNPEVANNVLMLTPFAETSEDEAVVNFVKKYHELHGKNPDQFAADAYDAVYVIKALLEKLAIKKSSEIDGATLSAAMTSLSYDGITGSMTWEANGNTIKNATAIIYHDGVGTEFKK